MHTSRRSFLKILAALCVPWPEPVASATTFSLSPAGIGYALGDTVEISSIGASARYIVTSVCSGGVVTSIKYEH